MARAHVDDTPPSSLNVDNGAAITTATSLIVASNRSVYAVWFWVPTTNTGTYTLELWEITGDDDPGPPGGTLLATKAVAAAGVTAGQWNRVNLDTPVAVVTTKAYRVARHASSGRYVATANTFSSASVSNGGITLVQSGTNPNALFAGVLRNGTFREGAAGNYPTSSFNASDYFVDVDDASDVPTPVAGVLSATTPVPVSTLAGLETFPGILAAATPAPVGALSGSVITPAIGTLAAGTVAPVGGIVGTVRNPALPTFTGPGLLDIMRENAEAVRVERARGPLDCPNCGWPLDYRGGVANCPAGDYRSR